MLCVIFYISTIYAADSSSEFDKGRFSFLMFPHLRHFLLAFRDSLGAHKMECVLWRHGCMV